MSDIHRDMEEFYELLEEKLEELEATGADYNTVVHAYKPHMTHNLLLRTSYILMQIALIFIPLWLALATNINLLGTFVVIVMMFAGVKYAGKQIKLLQFRFMLIQHVIEHFRRQP